MEMGIEMQNWDDYCDEAMRKDEPTEEYRKVDLTCLLEFYTFSVTGPNLPCLTKEGLAVEAWIRNKKGLLPSFLAKDLVFDEIRDPWIRKVMVLLVKDHKNPEEPRSNYLVKFYVERSFLRADDEYLHCIERPNDGSVGVHLSEELTNAFRTGFHHYTSGSRRLLYILDGIQFQLPIFSTRKRKFVNGTHVQIGIVETEERVTSYIPPNHSIGILDDCVDSVLKAIFRKAACRETGSLPESLCRQQTVRAIEVSFWLPGKPRPRRRTSKVHSRRLERRLRKSSSRVQSIESTIGIPQYDDKASQLEISKSLQEEGDSKLSQPEVSKPHHEEGDSNMCQPEASKPQESYSKKSQPEASKSQQEEGDSKEFQPATSESQQEEGNSKDSQSEAKQSQSKEEDSKNDESVQRASPRKNTKMAVRFDLPGEPRPQRIKPESQLTDSDAKVQQEAKIEGCQLAFDYQKRSEAAQGEMKGYKPAQCKKKDSKRVKFQLTEKELQETLTPPMQEVSESSHPATLESTNTKPARPSRGRRLRAFLASLFSCVPRSKRSHKADKCDGKLL